MKKIGLYWLDQDLRIGDNPNFQQVQNDIDELICLYCVDPILLTHNRYSMPSISLQRWRFLKESLHDLDRQLRSFHQHLFVVYAPPVQTIKALVDKYGVTSIYRSRPFGYYEQQQGQEIKKALPNLNFVETDSRTLFDLDQLPFTLAELPASFTAFRQKVDGLIIKSSTGRLKFLPPSPVQPIDWLADFPVYLNANNEPNLENRFHGGESAGLRHLADYFSGVDASVYKSTRNNLEGWNNSTKFSPWLANGSISARRLLDELRDYESRIGVNDSTYWIYFELLWREYFQWYALRYGKRLFSFKGIKNHKPLTSFYPARFRKWCEGATPYPLVNACMKQLNSTGYMSNRGRQIVASCLVNELSLDWRYGAAYFEQQLLDYDVACNWGNWQYLAGVGADPRGLRHFDIDKQTQEYDPSRSFIEYWQGDVDDMTLDSVTPDDWPIYSI